jgi:hypothetical protein
LTRSFSKKQRRDSLLTVENMFGEDGITAADVLEVQGDDSDLKGAVGASLTPLQAFDVGDNDVSGFGGRHHLRPDPRLPDGLSEGGSGGGGGIRVISRRWGSQPQLPLSPGGSNPSMSNSDIGLSKIEESAVSVAGGSFAMRPSPPSEPRLLRNGSSFVRPMGGGGVGGVGAVSGGGNWREAMRGSMARRSSAITQAAAEAAIGAVDASGGSVEASSMSFRRHLPGWESEPLHPLRMLNGSKAMDEEDDDVVPRHIRGLIQRNGASATNADELGVESSAASKGSSDWRNIIAGSVVTMRRNSTVMSRQACIYE